jgi:hypothetical protein
MPISARADWFHCGPWGQRPAPLTALRVALPCRAEIGSYFADVVDGRDAQTHVERWART